MTKLATLIWMVAAPTLMGICVVAVLAVPSLAAHDMKLILPAALTGAVLAMPISYFVAGTIKKLTHGQ